MNDRPPPWILVVKRNLFTVWILRGAAFAFPFLAPLLSAQTDAVFPAPDMATNLPLRKSDYATGIAPRIAELPPPVLPQLRLLPLAPAMPLAGAQLAVIRAPEAWRNWASLAQAHYAAGNFDKAVVAAQQMRAAAAARGDPLPLAADELFGKCKRAADALSLLE